MQNKLRNKLRGGIYLVSACSYLHSEPSHLVMLCGLLDELLQLVAVLVVAEEVGGGGGPDKWTNPDA